ncbi:MAG: hypothetical protein JOZ45_01055 [Acidobacteriaceae bacterium]|nr:hypothetical protein [Acidobacteriaceae bacterium]
MNHLSPQQLTDAYYGEIDPAMSEHLKQCSQCAGEYRLLEELLRTVRNMPVPEPEADYENRIWTRLLPQLPQRKSLSSVWFRPWILTPALLAGLAIAFLAGMLTQQHRHPFGIPEHARERVLIISLSDHLERSQVLLTEFLNAPPETLNLPEERSRARDLLEENRLLRQASVKAGDVARNATLSDLERVLLDLANSPPDLSRDDIQALRDRIREDGLLFKVRVAGAGLRREGQKL